MENLIVWHPSLTAGQWSIGAGHYLPQERLSLLAYHILHHPQLSAFFHHSCPSLYIFARGLLLSFLFSAQALQWTCNLSFKPLSNINFIHQDHWCFLLPPSEELAFFSHHLNVYLQSLPVLELLSMSTLYLYTPGITSTTFLSQPDFSEGWRKLMS